MQITTQQARDLLIMTLPYVCDYTNVSAIRGEK